MFLLIDSLIDYNHRQDRGLEERTKLFTLFITFLGILKGDSFEESLDIFSLLLNDSPGIYFSIFH